MTNDGLINLTSSIFDKVGKDINEYPFIQRIIDKQYIKTEKIFSIKIAVYMIFYFFPLMYQFFSASEGAI